MYNNDKFCSYPLTKISIDLEKYSRSKGQHCFIVLTFVVFHLKNGEIPSELQGLLFTLV